MTPVARSGWLLSHSLAIAFSLSHMILDWHLGLFGPLLPTALSPVQAAVLVWGAIIYAGWTASLVLAGQGSSRAMIGTLFFCIVGGLGNGLSIIACLPPCPGAAPFGDIGHLGSLVFGAWALISSWRAL